MFPLEEDMPIKPAETLAEMLALWNRPFEPRKLRSRGAEEIIEGNFASAKKLEASLPRKLGIEELPSQEELEAMKDSVKRDKTICYFIPTRSELIQIHQQGFGFREGRATLPCVARETLRWRMAQKYDVTFPGQYETLWVPRSYLDESQFWHYELTERFDKTMPKGWEKSTV